VPNQRDYSHTRGVDKRWSDHIRHHQEMERIRERETDAALRSLNLRLDAMNEFRASLEDFQSRSLSRDVYQTEHSNLQSRVAETDRRLENHVHLPIHPEAKTRVEVLETKVRKLEDETVKTATLAVVESEARRARKALGYTIIAGVILLLADLILTLLQLAAKK